MCVLSKQPLFPLINQILCTSLARNCMCARFYPLGCTKRDFWPIWCNIHNTHAASTLADQRLDQQHHHPKVARQMCVVVMMASQGIGVVFAFPSCPVAAAPTWGNGVMVSRIGFSYRESSTTQASSPPLRILLCADVECYMPCHSMNNRTAREEPGPASYVCTVQRNKMAQK